MPGGRKLGFNVSEETKKVYSLAAKKAGVGKWMKGRTGNIKLKEWAKKNINEKHRMFKGDAAGYRAKHCWIYIRLGKANHCELCGLDKIPYGMKRYFQWSNIDHKYKRKIEDYQQLCVKCHKKHDENIRNKPRAKRKRGSRA